MSKLAGKIALVTGAARGLGRGIALALANEGADIAVLDLNVEGAQQTARLVEEKGQRAIVIEADVRQIEDISRSVNEVVRVFGRLDILVNNAQMFPLGTLLDISEETVLAGWESGSLATLRFMRACHPHLLGGGVIINMSSPSAVQQTLPGAGVYSAIKCATQALTRAAAVEWAKDGIRALCILPIADGPASDLMMQDPAAREIVLNSIPLGKIGDSEHEIGKVIAFLCSSDAAYMTGSMIPIDGGATDLR
jgi:NAD(P)-dependent dehydrogenase (short-subunit alcohol dehydrogenase family)